ncbi:MAG: tRNA lysidine(34) synthetase TilS [Oscillospiraceae bacterium]|jgi:tRNA(Ile)-lysidine synthase|nr:tRNA lysidine(34) synthetase TilS [Oscillospiraceae bacterium]
MMDKVLEAIDAYDMLSGGETVICAVSGGPDSAAMLSALMELRARFSLSLAVCHVNHLMRGEESERDENFVRDFCAGNDLDFRLLRADVSAEAKRQGLSPEECGRNLRYGFFEKTAAEFGSGAKIATAHTLSDSVETVIFNLTRGCGLRGLCGIPPVRGNIIRPLVFCRRIDIENYLAEKKCGFVSDSSNRENIYSRNKIRNIIKPALEEINPGFEGNVGRAAGKFALLENYVSEEAQKLIDGAYIRREDGYALDALRRAHPALLPEAVLRLLGNQAHDINAKQIEAICAAVRSGRGGVNLSPSFSVSVSKEILRLKETSRAETAPVCVNARIGVNNFLENKKVFLEIYDFPGVENLKKVHLFLLKNSIDYDKINGKILLRTRRKGDAFKPFGRGNKSLKKLFNESSVPLEKRGGLAVLSLGEKILWIERFGVSAEFACTEDTKRALHIWTESKEGELTTQIESAEANGRADVN